MGAKQSKSTGEDDQHKAPASEKDLPNIDPRSRLRVRSPGRERPAPQAQESQESQDRGGEDQQEQLLPLSKEELEEAARRHVKTREETLVKIPNALVHLIDDQNSVLLAQGRLSLVRLLQDGNEAAVFARVGRDLQWPILQDEVTTKLDAAHYFFTLRVDPNDDDSQAGEKSKQLEHSESLSYGVTFKVKGNEAKLAKLDELLDKYSFFSKPKLVQSDDEQEKEQMVQGGKLGDNIDDKAVSPEVVKELETKPSEEKARLYWTAVAPNVDEYNTSIAKGIATGTGQVIRSIFWCSNSSVDQLEKAGKYLRQHTKGYEKPAEISPRTMRNVQRVRRVTQMSEKVARGILTGIISVTGFFTSAAVTSKIGQKFFKMLPGEVALASLDAFGKVFDALEMAGESVLSHATLVTTGVVSHKFGDQAGEMAHEGLASVGHILSTAWVVSKIRNAMNPKQAKGTTTSTSSMLKSAAKGALMSRHK